MESAHQPSPSIEPSVAMMPSPDIMKRRLLNTQQSALLQAPIELLKLIMAFLIDPIDLHHFTHACSLLLRLVDSRDWFGLYRFHYPTWAADCHMDEEPDEPTGASNWRRILLKDAYLRRRLTAKGSAAAPTLEGTPAAAVASPSLDDTHFRVQLNEAYAFPSDPTTTTNEWRRIGSPVYHIDNVSNTTIAASMLASFGRATPCPDAPVGGGETGDLGDRQILLYNLPDLTHPLAICGKEFWTGDRDNGDRWYAPFEEGLLQVVQVVDIKHYPETVVDNQMRVVIVLAFGENAGPLTQDASEMQILDVWRLVKIIEIWIPTFPAGTPIASSSLLASFGTGPSPLSRLQAGSAAFPSIPSCVRPRMGRVETLVTSINDNLMRGRISKLYTAQVQSPLVHDQGAEERYDPMSQNIGGGGGEVKTETVDCIAIFGIQHTDAAPAIVAKKIIFLENKVRADASWSRKPISRGVSCMTLFPYQSNFERMLVLFNRHGRGIIWDWVNERQVAHLHMPSDDRLRRPKPSTPATLSNYTTSSGFSSSHSSSGEPTNGLSSAVPTPGPSPTPPPAHPPSVIEGERPNLYYWGVQVSWTIELPYPRHADPQRRCSFRIVTLADGTTNEWESCWWHVDSDDLGASEVDLRAPPILLPHQKRPRTVHSNAGIRTLVAGAKRFERETVGRCLPEQLEEHREEDMKPLSFIAYLIWGHYRISLTSRLGILIMDLEDRVRSRSEWEAAPAVVAAEDEAVVEDGSKKDWQWVTFLDKNEDDPLVDIATFGDNLVITRRHGHLVWPLHGRSSSKCP
ncbi:hypothetical protein EC968_005163 [Mortierella alpina]|nr:hypothetical protein EC968_005163 [Mortierella alpina]